MLRKKKTFADEAREWADDVVETVRPHVDSARVAVDDFVHDRAVPALHEARDNAQPYLAAGAANLAEQAEHARVAAQDVADQVAESAGRPRKKKRSKLKIALVLGAVGGAAAYAAKKFQGGQQDAWTPPTPPAPVQTASDQSASGQSASDESASGQSSPAAPTEMAEESLGEESQDTTKRPDPLSDPIPPEDKP